MEEKNIHIIHQYLNKEINLEEVKKAMSESDFLKWKDTLNILQEMPSAEFDTEIEFEKLQQKKLQQNKIKSNNSYLKIASILVLFLATSFFITTYFFSNQDMTYVSSVEIEDEFILLPDDSKVKLNHSTSISYDKENWNTKRLLNLDGEAFFDVEEGETFTVRTDNGSVEVLGTTFNVKSDGKLFFVTCYTGKVKVSFSDKEYILSPGQSIDNKYEKVILVHKDTPSWFNKQSTFDDTSLAEVIRQIELQKNVEIEINVSDSLNYTGGFDTEMETSKILDLICQSLNLSYQKIDASNYKIYNQN